MISGADGNYPLTFGLCLVFILLVPFAIAGLALINAGLGRSRSAAQAMTSTVCVVGIAVLVYFVWGLAIQKFNNITAHNDPFALAKPGLFLRGVSWEALSSAAVLLPLLSVALGSLIPLGAGADRWRLSAACTSTIAFAGASYPLFACFAWHARVALLNWGSVGFVDAGGSGTIQ